MGEREGGLGLSPMNWAAAVQGSDAKKAAFRDYLQTWGVIDKISAALVAADEQRPANVIAFVRDQLVETDPEMTQLLQENHDQKRRIEELTRQLNEVNAKLA